MGCFYMLVFCIIEDVMWHMYADVCILVCVRICLETRLVWGESECCFSVCNAGGIEVVGCH